MHLLELSDSILSASRACKSIRPALAVAKGLTQEGKHRVDFRLLRRAEESGTAPAQRCTRKNQEQLRLSTVRGRIANGFGLAPRDARIGRGFGCSRAR